MSPILSFVLPCHARPERTRRMLECISNQTLTGWEGHIYGDACPYFASLLESEWYKTWLSKMQDYGNIVHTGNMPEHGGGHGYNIINKAIQESTGKYFVFLSNDDTISPNHFQHYVFGIQQLNELHQVEYDFAYYNTYVPANNNSIRYSNLTYGGCGHAELIVRTEFLKGMPPHGPEYGHDWHLIANMMQSGRCKKALSQDYTYEIKSIPGLSVDSID